MMAKDNAVEFCKLVESKLGWIPSGTHRYGRYVPDAAKVIRKRGENPDLYTWENLRAGVALLAHLKKTRSPVGVFAYVPRALELKAETPSDLEAQIHSARTLEIALGDPDGWAVRLARATGPYRREALEEWKAAQ